MKACIILPTYNEAENIGRLLTTLLNDFKEIDDEMHILVCDDNSPDGTSDIVRQFIEKHPNVHLSVGEKKGLGVAYIRGFKFVLKNLESDVLFQMDADFSHEPREIPNFLAQIHKGYDVVIGSRYVPGGGLDGIMIHRKLISRGGNFFARHVAGLHNIRDCTSGFRAIRVSILRQIDFSRLYTKGYAFLLTLLFELSLNKAKIIEIPIRFPDRRHGQTKLNKGDMVEFFKTSLRLRARRATIARQQKQGF